MKTKGSFAGLLALTALSAFTVREARADFCLIGAGGVRYQLQWGTGNPGSGTPLVVTGTRVIAQFRAPVFGSLIVNGTTVVVGLNEAFDFGSGAWTHPNGTTVFTFPPAGGGGPTYDTTYHGNGVPHNVKGGLTGTSCPVTIAPSTAPEAGDNPDANLGPAPDANPSPAHPTSWGRRGRAWLEHGGRSRRTARSGLSGRLGVSPSRSPDARRAGPTGSPSPGAPGALGESRQPRSRRVAFGPRRQRPRRHRARRPQRDSRAPHGRCLLPPSRLRTRHR